MKCIDCKEEYICNCIICFKPVCAVHLLEHEWICNGDKTPEERRKII